MEKKDLENFINFTENPIDNISWNNEMRNEYNKNGILSLKNLLTKDSVEMLKEESVSKIKYAYFNPKEHNVYLKPVDNSFSKDHPRNINVLSSKGCITDDIISKHSLLRTIYKSLIFNFGDDKMLPNLLVVSEQPIPEFRFINQYYDTITNDYYKGKIYIQFTTRR